MVICTRNGFMKYVFVKEGSSSMMVTRISTLFTDPKYPWKVFLRLKRRKAEEI